MTTVLQRYVPPPSSGCRNCAQGDTAVKLTTGTAHSSETLVSTVPNCKVQAFKGNVQKLTYNIFTRLQGMIIPLHKPMHTQTQTAQSEQSPFKSPKNIAHLRFKLFYVKG
jgi:hypothetical protein